MRNPHNVQSYSEPVLLLFQFLRGLHHHEHQIGDHDEEWAILGENAEPSDEPAILGGELAGGDIEGGLPVIVGDDALINIHLQLHSGHIFRVGSFQIAEEGHPME